MRLEYVVNPRKLGLILGIFALYLAGQSLIVEHLIENVLDNEAHRSLVLAIDLFSVNSELTIPTWYSVLLLFTTTALLAVIAAAKRARQELYARYWIGLAVIFLYLSLDEGAAIHEIVADALQRELNPSGFLFFGWQIVAAPLVILFGVLYLRFLFHLPPRTRNLFVLAGTIYVGGALLVEGVSANQLSVDGAYTFRYLAIATVEELAEMLGVIVFLYALLSYALEMEYTLVLNPQTIVQETDEPTRSLGQILRSFLQRRPVILALVVILGLNLALVSWALTQEPQQEPITQNTVSPTQAIIDQLVTEGVVATAMVGRFDTSNLTARQVTASLLALFDEVVVVTLPANESSLALAGDELPFDRNSVSEILHAYGVTQFIIFDTPAVRAIVGNVEARAQQQ